MSDSRSCGRCQYFYNNKCQEESKCMRDVDEAKYYGIIEGRKQGRADYEAESEKIFEENPPMHFTSEQKMWLKQFICKRYQQGRQDAIEDVMFAFKHYQNMHNPKDAHIFWEMLEQMQKGGTE